MVITTEEAFESARARCNGENAEDEDIECVDLAYPLKVSIFDPVSLNLNTFEFETDRELNLFLSGLDVDDVTMLTFPVTLNFADGTEQEVEDLEGLEALIEGTSAECDEDDDYNYSDDV